MWIRTTHRETWHHWTSTCNCICLFHFSGPIKDWCLYQCSQDILSHSPLTSIPWQRNKNINVELWHVKNSFGQGDPYNWETNSCSHRFPLQLLQGYKSMIKNLGWLASMFIHRNCRQNVLSQKTNGQSVKKVLWFPVSKNNLPHPSLPGLGWLYIRTHFSKMPKWPDGGIIICTSYRLPCKQERNVYVLFDEHNSKFWVTRSF